MITQNLKQLVLFFISLGYSFWSNLILIPIFVLFNLYELIKQVIRDLISMVYCFLVQLSERFSLHRLVRSTIDWIKYFKGVISRDLQQPRNPLLGHSRTEQQIAATFLRAAASPDEITENQKVLLLMQKMRKLEETIFQQSNDRRRAQTELFEVKTQLQEKNTDLTKERSQCVENMNKISLLKFQISEKNQLLDKSTKHVTILQAEVKQMKQRIEQLVREKQKQKERISSEILQQREAHENLYMKVPQLQHENEGLQNSINS